MGGLPAEGALEFFLTSNQNGGITGPAWPELAGNFAAGDAFGGSDHFEDRKTAAVADVEGFAGNAVDGFERADVGIRDVEDVDVIANASAVRGRIVRPENVDMSQIAGGGVQNARNEMRLDTMMFTELLRGAGGIEIAEHGIFEARIGAIVRENLFEHELGFAVRIDGSFAMVFGNGNDFRFAVGGGRRRKDEFLRRPPPTANLK